ncbi:hypothetical protein OAT16_09765 [Prolixibacteraceae bacterium]|nr:hypothetical protein [Prolixibacteraceae bacterium]
MKNLVLEQILDAYTQLDVNIKDPYLLSYQSFIRFFEEKDVLTKDDFKFVKYCD